MSTPTPSVSKPGPQNAATPQSYAHLAAFSSPAPRSVPSPATQRTQAGKSPFNASTTQPPGSAGTNAASNHPTTGSSASGVGRLLASSPAAAMLNFDSPAAMALSLSNMGGLDGGIGMGISMSGLSALNLGTSMGGRGDDEDRRKRLEAVVNLLKSRPARVGPEGLELLGKRVGMAVLLDPSDGPRKNGTRECAIAGGSVVIDVGFSRDHSINRVDLTFPTSSDAVNQHLGSASRILQDNLVLRKGVSPITINLDKFSKNLERLAKLDKLNGPMSSQNFNCFEAIAGVYTSLKKLFEHEKKAALILLDAKSSNKEEKVEREVMCKKSGRPVMNARQTVGLGLDYWMKKRHVFAKKPLLSPKTADDMDIDVQGSEAGLHENPQDLFSLSIECESSAPEMYPSLRVSDSWISDQIIKRPEDPVDVFGEVLDWQEPPSTYLTDSNVQDDSMALDGSGMGKLPSIRFVAKLDPPLVVPLQVAVNVLGSVGIQVQQDMYTPTYHNLLLNLDTDPLEYYGSPKEARHLKQVLRKTEDGKEEIRSHSNTFIPRSVEYGKVLEQIPFSHPKQLIQILPTLRQWAMTNSLITESFAAVDSVAGMDGKRANNQSLLPLDISLEINLCRFGVYFPRSTGEVSLTNGHKSGAEPSLYDLLGDTSGGSLDPSSTGQVEKVGHGIFNSSVQISFDILPNGDISIVKENVFQPGQESQNGNESSESKGLDEKALENSRKVAKSLDIAGDLDIWVEWLDRLTAQQN